MGQEAKGSRQEAVDRRQLQNEKCKMRIAKRKMRNAKWRSMQALGAEPVANQPNNRPKPPGGA